MFLPAFSVPLTYYGKLFEAWAARGRHVVGVELRGMPQSPVGHPRRVGFGYADLVRADLPAVFAGTALSDAGRVIVMGHSLGGQLALLASAAGTIRPDAVVTIGSGTSSPASQRTRIRRWRRVFGVRFVGAVLTVCGYWPGNRLGFAGDQPKQMMRDWAHEARHGRYRLGGDPTDYESALASLDLPALLIDLDGDRMTPVEAVDQLAAKLPSHAVRTTVVGEPGRRGGSDHFLWARRTPKVVIDAVEDWLAPQGL